jgi:hypothetical protein
VGEPIALALAHDRLDLEACFEGPDRHDGFGFEADNSVVVRLGRVFIEPALRVLGTGFVGVGDLGDAPNCDLGCEFKVLPQIPTARLVQVELPNGRGPAWPANYRPHSPARGCGEDVCFLGVSLMLATSFMAPRSSSSVKQSKGPISSVA